MRFSPQPSSGNPRTWAGAILLLSGVGMIFLAGCFLIGAMYLVKPELLDPQLKTDTIGPEAWYLVVACSGIAGACLIGAAVLRGFGARIFLRVANEPGPSP